MMGASGMDWSCSGSWVPLVVPLTPLVVGAEAERADFLAFGPGMRKNSRLPVAKSQ